MQICKYCIAQLQGGEEIGNNFLLKEWLVNFDIDKTIYAYIINIALEVPEKFSA